LANIVRITLRLNLDCPEDAAIYNALMMTTKGRLNQRLRSLLAVGLGLEQAPTRVQAKPTLRLVAAPQSEQQSTPVKSDEELLENATDNFLNAFG
jgi:hypothetical protein